MEPEDKIKIEETTVNLGYLKEEFDNEQRNNADSLTPFSDGDAIIKTESVKLEDVKENDLIQEAIELHQLEIIQCHCCKVCFEEWGHLENHMLHCHGNYNRLYDNKLITQRKPADKIEEYQGNSEISAPIDDIRSCLTPTETIDSKHHLKTHIMNIHLNTNEKKYKCSHCSYQTDRKCHLKLHLNTHNNSKPFECNFCKKKFTQKGSLKRHIMVIHSNMNEKKYKCSECSYQTNYKAHLKIHLDTHNNSKSFECYICKKGFTRKDYLKIHIMNVHFNINDKKYKCSECSYESYRKGNLKTHLNTHYNYKPFECDICKKRFTQIRSLKTHTMVTHSNINEKKYKCSECCYRTNYKCHLKTHLDTHNNSKWFECDICKKRFNWKCDLKRHIMSVHLSINEKKYRCSECSYQTVREGHLKKHLKTHCNYKPFECDICKKRFTLTRSLKAHIMNVHSNVNEKK